MSIIVYYASIEALKDQKLYEQIFKRLPMQRQVMIQKRKHDTVQRLSLGAGALMVYGMAHGGIKAEELELAFTENGKPYLAKDDSISFNLSHSGEYAMAVFSDKGIAVGCDIERILQRDRDVAKRFFTEEEQQAIAGGIDFFRIWTLKESFIKATAEGLGRDLRTFSIVPGEGEYRFLAGKQSGEFQFVENEVDSYRMSVCYKSKKRLDVTWKLIDLSEVNWNEL